jgi:hypothetical protein
MVFDVDVEIRGVDGIVRPGGRVVGRTLPALGWRITRLAHHPPGIAPVERGELTSSTKPDLSRSP